MAPNQHPQHPALQIVTINGKPMVSGLYWKPLRSVRSYMTEAKQIGKQEGMEMVTIRKTRTVIQAGFAPKGKHRLKGMYSLAAALAGQLGDNWIGAFEVEADRYAMVAVYKGAVVPGYDFIGSRDEAEAKAREVYGLLSSNPQDDFKNGQVIAPAEWEFGDKQIDIRQLLTAKTVKNDYRLRPLTLGLTARELVFIAIGVVALGAGAFGTKAWLDEKAATKSRLLERAAAIAKLNQAQEAKATLVRPWLGLPSAQDVLQACNSFLHNTPLSVGGWLFTGSHCAPGKAIASYARQERSPVESFVADAQRVSGALPGIFEQGQAGSIESTVDLQPHPGDELQNTGQLLLAFTSHMQAAGNASLTLTEKPFTPDPNNPDAPVPDWTTNEFQVQTAFPPERLFDGLNLNGVRVMDVATTLNADAAELTWTVTGELYGR